MKKRKQNKIIEDADLILEVAKDCCTYSEIVEKTGISINKVRLSVKKAGMMKKIKKILLENKKIKILLDGASVHTAELVEGGIILHEKFFEKVN